MSKKAKEEQSFEASLGELEALVERMEAGELSLEESLKQYERGVSLTRACEEALDKARQKIEELSASDSQASKPDAGGEAPEDMFDSD